MARYRITRDGILEFLGSESLTVAQAAEICGMSPEWLRRQIRLCKVRGAYRLPNGHWMIEGRDTHGTRIMLAIDAIRSLGDTRSFDEIIRQWARDENAPTFVAWLESGGWME